MAIAVDTHYQQQASASANVYTHSGIVVNNSNSVMVIFLDYLTANSNSVTALQWNGSSTGVTQVTSQGWPANAIFQYIYVVTNPNTGNHSFTATVSGVAAPAMSSMVYVCTGADIGTPSAGSNTVLNGSAATSSINITPSSSNGLMLSEYFGSNGGTVTAGANVNTLYSGYWAGQKGGNSIGATITSGVSFSQTYNVTPNDGTSLMAIILKVSSGSTTNPPFKSLLGVGV